MTPLSFRFANPSTATQQNFNALADTSSPDPVNLAPKTLAPDAAKMNVAYNYLLGWASSSGRDGALQFHAEWNKQGGDTTEASQLVNNFNHGGQYPALGVGSFHFAEVLYTKGTHDHGPFGEYTLLAPGNRPTQAFRLIA